MTPLLYEDRISDTTEDHGITLFVTESQMVDGEPPIDWRWIAVGLLAIILYPAYSVVKMARRLDRWFDAMEAAYMRFDGWMLDIISKAIYNLAPEIMRVSHG